MSRPLNGGASAEKIRDMSSRRCWVLAPDGPPPAPPMPSGPAKFLLVWTPERLSCTWTKVARNFTLGVIWLVRLTPGKSLQVYTQSLKVDAAPNGCAPRRAVVGIGISGTGNSTYNHLISMMPRESVLRSKPPSVPNAVAFAMLAVAPVLPIDESLEPV